MFGTEKKEVNRILSNKERHIKY